MPMTRAVLLGVEARSLVNFRRDIIAILTQEHEVHVVARAASPDEERVIAQLGAILHKLPMARTGMNPLRDLFMLVGLVKLLRRLRPNYLLAYTSKPVIFGTLAGWLARVPVRVAMITGLGYSFIKGDEPKRKFARKVSIFLYGLALPLCTSVIFQNPDDRDEFRQLGLLKNVNQVHVVNGSGVDVSQFTSAPLPNGPVFLMIARLLVDKGSREYGAAAKIVRQAMPSVKCQLLGPLDPSPNGLKADELEALKLDGLEYLGETDDVRQVIAAASIIVLPSYREGTPRSVLEGMAMGRAIITTDVPGCRETVVNGVNGLLVPVRNADALAQAMIKLAKAPDLIKAMGRESRRIAVEKYDAKVVALDTLQKAGILLRK